MVTHRLWKRARTRPQRAVCKRRLRRCENDRLQVDHTFRMPAKVGPKRVHALARAGCYFGGGATVCGVNAFAICEERGILFIGRDCARRVQTSALRPRHYGRKTTNPSVVLQGKYGLCRSARNEGHSVALSRVRALRSDIPMRDSHASHRSLRT